MIRSREKTGNHGTGPGIVPTPRSDPRTLIIVSQRPDKGSDRYDHGTSKHDRKSGQSSSQKTEKEESLHAKLLARKEQEKWYKKIVENPVLYIEERTNLKSSRKNTSRKSSPCGSSERERKGPQ